ncbi:hypothetical protein [Rhodococcus jostii]|uniref:hypothetical protein n=1 Tax=Rhodococcus jostii TaxID=132919 RepID=UPI00364C8D84
MTDTDHLFLSRAEIRKLVALLRETPELVDELAVTITRQDRIGTPGSAGKNRGEEQPLPFNVTAAEAADDLHTTLVAWVRHVCESRRVDYDGRDGTLGVARWLDRNVIALAMTEGSGEALDEIQYAMRRARWATDRPKVAKVLLGFCGECGCRVYTEPDCTVGRCTCGIILTVADVQDMIDVNLASMMLPAKEAAAMISNRYGVPIKPKTVYDMGYRKKDPIRTVEVDGAVTYPLRLVIEDLRKRGKLA